MEQTKNNTLGCILDTPSGKFKTMLVDTVEKLELPLAHMIPELTANILIPIRNPQACYRMETGSSGRGLETGRQGQCGEDAGYK
ncbi:hypothetical protein LQE92_02950 [Lacrimispora sp. NSJ-141]|uniref:Uncharacterized protein n=1 Tax=Lientehia hominis TaxID=2897778 RepID=A0AAP2RH80_9FIRM|nr:hypothetical protein [Lientehia hominis]MCD2491585.1 hypothetical protein [Lientehia hominis]